MRSSGETQNETGRGREGGATGLFVERLDFVDRILLAMPDDGAVPGREDVLVPIDIMAVCQLDDETVGDRRDNNWGLVELAAPPSNVANDGKGTMRRARNPAR